MCQTKFKKLINFFEEKKQIFFTSVSSTPHFFFFLRTDGNQTQEGRFSMHYRVSCLHSFFVKLYLVWKWAKPGYFYTYFCKSASSFYFGNHSLDLDDFFASLLLLLETFWAEGFEQGLVRKPQTFNFFFDRPKKN